MEWIAVLIVLIVALLFFVKNLPVRSYNYRKNGSLFTPAERSFIRVLDQAVSDECRVFGKVRVADIISPAKGMSRKNWQIAFNKISSKHFDFVLCSKDGFEVVAVIELDDKSHNSKKVRSRDELLEKACASADLKLVRFSVESSYNVRSVREKIGFVFL